MNNLRYWIDLVEDQLNENIKYADAQQFLQDFVNEFLDEHLENIIEELAPIYEDQNALIKQFTESVVSQIEASFLRWSTTFDVEHVKFIINLPSAASWNKYTKTVKFNYDELIKIKNIIFELAGLYHEHAKNDEYIQSLSTSRSVAIENQFYKNVRNQENKLQNLLTSQFLTMIHEVTHALQDVEADFKPITYYSYAVKGKNRKQKFYKMLSDKTISAIEYMIAHKSSPHEIEAYAIQSANQILHDLGIYDLKNLESSIEGVDFVIKNLNNYSKILLQKYDYVKPESQALLAPKVIKRFYKKLYQALNNVLDDLKERLTDEQDPESIQWDRNSMELRN